VPTTSSWPAWPIKITQYPAAANRRTSTCTFFTSGAGRVDGEQLSGGRVAVDSGRDAVRREHESLALRDGRLRLDEPRAERLEVANHMRVVDDLLTYIDGRAVDLEGALHRLHGSLHSGAVASVRGDDHPLHQGAQSSRASGTTPMRKHETSALRTQHRPLGMMLQLSLPDLL
jgi:phage baseplate assembly protein gpV